MDSTPPRRGRDQRGAERFDAALPVTVAGGAGQTLNVSAEGVYFETDVQQHVGAMVNFTVEFTLYGRKHRLVCEGTVVRVEQQGQRVGVAARLAEPFFEEVETNG